MENLLKDKKKLGIIAGALGVLIIILVVVLAMSNGNKTENKVSLEDNLTKLANQFYEEHYYTGLQDKSTLSSLKESGLNISVTHLDVIVPIDDETKNMLDDRKCNYDNTKVYIYPEESYGAKDYKVKVELACEK